MFVKRVHDGDCLMELWRFNELMPKKADQAQGSPISPCSPTANYGSYSAGLRCGPGTW